MGQKLKIFRRIFSSFFFMSLTLFIIIKVPGSLYDHIISSQPGPLILKLSSGAKFILFSGTASVLLLIVFLGRSYCSLLCPLGYLQDVFIRLGRIAGIKPRWKIAKIQSTKFLRLTILLVSVVLFIKGTGFLSGIIEPFSIYSRPLFLVARGPEIYKLAGIAGVSLLLTLFPILIILLLSMKLGRFFVPGFVRSEQSSGVFHI